MIDSAVSLSTIHPKYSVEDSNKIKLLDSLSIALIPIWAIVCMLSASLLFYRVKLNQPLAKLKRASLKIADNDLDFNITYVYKDKLVKYVYRLKK